ncbi:hypothetical protein B0293_01005 [Amycolatopsis azurea DSM 43854]|uniref:Uncharacterized protein n=1 Tax=Amycolatopsis azurea DSM 43854 TaxID=1238180 RepID=A0ABX3JNT8_9PSEU|nr:hypothetical protein B0293_01005 [Amycolatopsis azurea DSM 43854]
MTFAPHVDTMQEGPGTVIGMLTREGVVAGEQFAVKQHAFLGRPHRLAGLHRAFTSGLMKFLNDATRLVREVSIADSRQAFRGFAV